ncbi:MAG: AI-2E family transporter [Gammaproteobacteria bacterium]
MQKALNNSFFILVGLVVVAIIYFLSPILTPFLVAALISYLAAPIVDKLTSWHVPRLLSVILVFMVLLAIIILLLLCLIPLVGKQIIALIDVIPNTITWMQDIVLPWLDKTLGIQASINVTTIKETLAENWSKAGDVANWVVKKALQSGRTLVEWMTNLLLIPVVTFYLLRDWDNILNNVRGLLPRHIEPTFVKIVKECDAVLSAFFRGQLLVMLSLGVIYSIGLTAIGLQIGLIIGAISGLVSIVPYLGFIVGIVSASIAAYVQFGTFTSILLVWLVFAIGQSLESTLLTPKLVGHRIGLHPVAVIFAVLAGGSLFGFFGVLLALPVAAVIMVWLRFLNQSYRHSRLYK